EDGIRDFHVTGVQTCALPIYNEPEKLYDIPGIKKELIKGLVRAWADNQAVRQTMIFLQGYGVTSRMAARIYNHYGAATINKVQRSEEHTSELQSRENIVCRLL